MITLILIFLASLAGAVSDKLAAGFETTIFAKLNPVFWDVKQSASLIDIFGYPCNAWFVFRVALILFSCMAIVTYSPVTVPLADFILFFGAWVMNYHIFHGLVLRKR